MLYIVNYLQSLGTFAKNFCLRKNVLIGKTTQVTGNDLEYNVVELICKLISSVGTTILKVSALAGRRRQHEPKWAVIRAAGKRAVNFIQNRAIN